VRCRRRWCIQVIDSSCRTTGDRYIGCYPPGQVHELDWGEALGAEADHDLVSNHTHCICRTKSATQELHASRSHH
jgi:hypothetical protein